MSDQGRQRERYHSALMLAREQRDELLSDLRRAEADRDRLREAATKVAGALQEYGDRVHERHGAVEARPIWNASAHLREAVKEGEE